MLHLLWSWAILTGAVLVTCAIMRPKVYIRKWQTAIVVAAVLGVLHAVLYRFLMFLTLPANFLTLGLFTFVVLGFLLWLTDKILGDSFEIKGFFWTILAAASITLFDRCGHYFLG